ncbi:MAG: enoyl-CoA hydratase/isomerase family protein [Deltaproteobacteria bacterium]|nr:enoyl-CoA hydratase/isomerase family protein [Deltaproteobacteria bacterium]MBI3389548.1 enoyl-CoA hydratase/isomerase family protein [Deltaproteobacteria bacterium]
MAYEQILCEESDGIATITLNRPERLNAFTSVMGRELHEAFRDYDADDRVRVIIVTGAGRGFCAGADLAGGGGSFGRDSRTTFEQQVESGRRAIRPWAVKKPIIGAINGAAVGVGITLAMQWDIRIAAESAKIAFAFVRRGVVPEALSTWILPRLIGVSRAAEVLLSGRTLTAREALDFGLLSRVVPDAELLPTARTIAEDIARNAAPVSVAITKRLIWSNLAEPDMQRAEAVEGRAFWWSGTQPDSFEGVRSFLEKRAPQWKMKPSSDMPDFLPKPK